MFIVPLTRPAVHLARSFDRSLDRFFAAEDSARSPALDVAETDASYAVTLDLPGVAKEDVKVTIDGRRVSVQAEAQRSEDKNEGDRIVYRERAATRFARTFTLPVEIDQTESGARLDNGVLTLTLAKRGANSAAQLTVN
jgi:HSP20 family protein